MQHGSQSAQATPRSANTIKSREEFLSGNGLATIGFSNRLEEFCLLFCRKVNFLLRLLGQDSDGLAFSKI